MVWDLDPTSARYSRSAGRRARPKSRRTGRRWVFVALVVVVAIGLTLYLRRDTASAALHGAVTTSLAAHSASFELNETVGSPSLSFDVRGRGECALASGDCSMSLLYRGAPDDLSTETMKLVGGVTYVRFNAAIERHLKTPWISLPTVATSSVLAQFGFSAGPLGAFEFVGERGVAVEVEGTSSGATTRPYLASASASLPPPAASGLPTWLSTELSSFIVGDESELVEVNASNRIDRVVTTTSVLGYGTTIHVRGVESVTYSNATAVVLAPTVLDVSPARSVPSLP